MSLFRHLLAAILLAGLALAALSCGGSDKSPTGSNNQPEGDDFDQATAVATSKSSAVQGVGLVQSMTSLAAGVGSGARADGYGWNPDTQQWEWHYEWNQAGYDYIWNYSVQYLDAMGEPQQNGSGASSLKHAMTGTGHYDVTQNDAHIVYDYAYNYSTLITGIGSGLLTMTGEGGQDIDYSYSYGDIMLDYDYVVSWEIQDGGITVNEGRGGCPSGSIHYALNPYSMELVFEADNSAPYTLYDSDDEIVPAGSGSQPMECAN